MGKPSVMGIRRAFLYCFKYIKLGGVNMPIIFGSFLLWNEVDAD